VIVQAFHFVGEKDGWVLLRTARAIARSDGEDLVHADVNRVGLEHIRQLIQQSEDGLVNLRMLRAVAHALGLLGVRVLHQLGVIPRLLFVLGILAQQRAFALS